MRVRLFLIDSGGEYQIIDTGTAKEFTEVDESPRYKIEGLQGVVRDTSWANIASPAFAGLKLHHPHVLAVSLDKLSDSLGVGLGGALNMPVSGNMTLTIDYRAGAIRIEKP